MKHKKHAQTGIFFVFKGKDRVGEVQVEGQDEGGSKHIKRAQTGVFYVFKGKDRVSKVVNT